VVLEEDGTDGDGIPADAVVVDGDVEGGGSGGGWKEIIEWLCRSTPVSDDLIGKGSIGIGRAAASDRDEISLQSIVSREDELHFPGMIDLDSSSSGGGRGGGGGGGGRGTAFVRMP